MRRKRAKDETQALIPQNGEIITSFSTGEDGKETSQNKGQSTQADASKNQILSPF